MWGAARFYALPAESETDFGTGPECAARLDDPHGRISRRHASVVRAGASCTIVDRMSTNGTWVDGARRSTSILAPGSEVSMGNATLVAESEGFIALRHLVGRLVGFSRIVDIDHALRGIRDAATLRTVLVLIGDGDLAPVASRIHRATLGDERAFVAPPPGAPAFPHFAAAEHGTLCISMRRPPPDMNEVIAATRVPASRVRLVICSTGAEDDLCKVLRRTAHVVLPTLTTRHEELAEVLGGYADDAQRNLVVSASITDEDLVHAGDGCVSHAEAEIAAMRLVVIRAFGVTAGATRLGLSHAALSRWARRRGLATHISPSMKT
jgi:hypothetical protein